MAVRHERLPKAAAPVLSRRAHDAVLVAIVAGLLIGFAVVVVREVLATLGVIDGGKGDQYQLFAVSLTGLAGGVFTVALRAEPRSAGAGEPRAVAVDALRSGLATAFALAYVAPAPSRSSCAWCASATRPACSRAWPPRSSVPRWRRLRACSASVIRSRQTERTISIRSEQEVRDGG